MMAVGQIISGANLTLRGRSKRGRTCRIRLLSDVGFYPRGQLQGSKGIYHLDDELGFVAVITDEQRAHKYWSEVTFLAFEEIRFLSALLLSMRPDHGVLRIYPSGAHVIRAVPDGTMLLKHAKRLALKYRSAVSTPLSDGKPYQISGYQTIDNKRYKKLVAKISIRDHLLLRGLSAILKADMLEVHQEFREEAQSLRFVAMEVAFQLTLRALREKGVKNPSAFDAGEFLYSNFPNEPRGMKFFDDYYEDRTKTFHPHNRHGTFAFPPLSASHGYGLRAGLIFLFQFLITGEIWYTLWD